MRTSSFTTMVLTMVYKLSDHWIESRAPLHAPCKQAQVCATLKHECMCFKLNTRLHGMFACCIQGNFNTVQAIHSHEYCAYRLLSQTVASLEL